MKKKIYIVLLLSISCLLLIANFQCSTNNRSYNLDTAKSYYDSAYQCLVINDYSSALPKLIKTVELIESLPEDMNDEELHLTSRAYYQMGHVFQTMIINSYAAETALRASQYQEIRQDTTWMLYTKVRLATQYQNMEEIDSVEYYIEQITALSDSVKYLQEYYMTLGIIAFNYYQKKEYDTAFILFQDKINFKNRHNLSTLEDSVGLGILMFHSPYKYQSKQYLLKTFDMIARNNNVNMRDMGLTAYLLSKIYDEEGDKDSVNICNKLLPEFIDDMAHNKSDEMKMESIYEQFKSKRNQHLNELKLSKEKRNVRIRFICSTLVILIVATAFLIKKKTKKQQDIVSNYAEKWSIVEQSELLQLIKSKLVTDNGEKITVKNIDKYSDRILSNIDLVGINNFVDNTFDGLFTRLVEQYPDLNQYDVYCCCLSLLGLTKSEMAVLLGVKYSAVSNRVAKIKKALNTEEEIRDFMIKYYSKIA